MVSPFLSFYATVFMLVVQIKSLCFIYTDIFISVYVYICLTYSITIIICYKYYIFVQADMCALSAYMTTSLSYWTVENLTTLSAMTY